jgi:hypothetical protein
MSERKVGRPKGRNYENISLSLTHEQAEFLATKPNASALVRQLIDSMREAATLSSEYMRTLELKNRLDELNERIEQLKRKSDDAMKIDSKHFAGHVTIDNNFKPIYILDDPDNPEPIDDEGRFAIKFRDATNAEVKRIEQEIAKVRAELLET